MGAPAGSADRAVQLAAVNCPASGALAEPPSPSRAPLPSHDAPSPNVSEVTTGTTAERLRPDADTLARWEREAEESVAKEMAAAAAAAAAATTTATETGSAPAAAWTGAGTGRPQAGACAVSTEDTEVATGVRARKRLQREHDEQQGLYASDAKAMGRAIQIVRSKAIRARCKAQLAHANALKGALVKLARQVKVAKAQQAKFQRQQYGTGSSTVAGGGASAGTVTTPGKVTTLQRQAASPAEAPMPDHSDISSPAFSQRIIQYLLYLCACIRLSRRMSTPVRVLMQVEETTFRPCGHGQLHRARCSWSRKRSGRVWQRWSNFPISSAAQMLTSKVLRTVCASHWEAAVSAVPVKLTRRACGLFFFALRAAQLQFQSLTLAFASNMVSNGSSSARNADGPR